MRRCVGIFIFLLSFAPMMAQSDLAFPQIAVGGQFETVLQIINEVATNNNIVIDVFQGSSAGAANGTPFPVRFDGGSPLASRTLTLTSFQELTTILTTTDTVAKNGWVRIRSTTPGGKISGNLLFRQKSGTAVIDSVGVSSPQRFRYAVIQVDSREDGTNTGVAFVNPDTTPVNVTIDLYQADRFVATFPQTLQPNQHFAKFVSEMFPTFGKQQGKLKVSTQARNAIPYLTLRADGIQLTGIPVRPLGLVFQYTVSSSGTTVETGSWMFDFVGFDLIGLRRKDSDPAGSFFGARGIWSGNNFKVSYRTQFSDNSIGVVVFSGTSAGVESTLDGSGTNQPITGKVTTIGANGQALPVNDFSAVLKF